MTRRPLVAGNWKMNKTVAAACELAQQLCALDWPAVLDVVICPPFTALAAVADQLRGSRIRLGAQNMHEASHGAFTGEISPTMLRDLGVTHVILGHSERRQYCGETDAAIARKVHAALDHDLTPIVAVGETATEHAAGHTLTKVQHQTRAALAGLTPAQVARCVIAYEPIWAIGTGAFDEPTTANATMEHIRTSVHGLRDARLLYGGSMNANNASALMAQPSIDGGLIGGASLTAAGLAGVIAAVAGATAAQ